MSDQSNSLLAILGPTASGKTAHAIRLAKSIGGEIISVDSRQVYRQMAIGTAKPTLEEQQSVRHHLIDTADVDEKFSAADFQTLADRAIQDIRQRGKVVLLVGGSGLYFRALVDGLFSGPAGDENFRHQLKTQANTHGPQYLHRELQKVDPHTANKIHPNNLVRVIRALEVYHLSGQTMSDFQPTWDSEPRYNFRAYVLKLDRQYLYQRIETRVDKMIEHGWVQEVQDLLSAGYSPLAQPLRSFGYNELINYLDGRTALDTAVEQIKLKTRRYAKRQLTWFRADQRLKWVDPEQLEDQVLSINFSQ
ncbi:tRNA (adenosine(37)-N6)-dimethylallyltransferase MiaA [Candidatus Poribacteria bacterium]|nr:tRNA (adenosine(37)-N6)-dimethylallyltransferase MiaA [Candidatus Poribacteria bacterium]